MASEAISLPIALALIPCLLILDPLHLFSSEVRFHTRVLQVETYFSRMPSTSMFAYSVELLPAEMMPRSYLLKRKVLNDMMMWVTVCVFEFVFLM